MSSLNFPIGKVLALLIMSFVLGMLVCLLLTWHHREQFYDGEGNTIPTKAIHILVDNQFVHISKEDSLELHKYFYVTY